MISDNFDCNKTHNQYLQRKRKFEYCRYANIWVSENNKPAKIITARTETIERLHTYDGKNIVLSILSVYLAVYTK